MKLPISWLSELHEPQSFLVAVREVMDSIEDDDLFNNPKYQILFDGYAAGRLAATRGAYEPCLVRLVADHFPDFELTFGETVEHFEFTEADRAGRSRGDEYRRAAERRRQGLPSEGELFSPYEEDLAAREAIPRVIQAKANKHYRPKPHLFVLVNLTIFEDPDNRGFDLVDMTQPWSKDFESIWLLWGNFCFRTWPTPLKLRVPKDAQDPI